MMITKKLMISERQVNQEWLSEMRPSHPKLSLLIASYNNFSLFEACYNSIRMQTCNDYEVIIVDDCSTDGSYEKIQQLTATDNQVKVFRNTLNRGVGFTKRRCVELSSGVVCAFLDPDDKLSVDAVEIILETYRKSPGNVVAVYSRFYLCDERLRIKKIFPGSRPIKNDDPLFSNLRLHVNHFFSFRRDAYERTSGIKPALSSAVDQDLYMKLYEQGHFLFIPDVLYYYRQHSKGVSQSLNMKDKLRENWHQVLKDTFERRKIHRFGRKPLIEIEDLPAYLFRMGDSILVKIRNLIFLMIFCVNQEPQKWISTICFTN